MAMDRRRKNEEWAPANPDGSITWERVDTALLMDIRDELKVLNRILGCRNAIDIPNILRRIDRNTKKRKRKPKEQS